MHKGVGYIVVFAMLAAWIVPFTSDVPQVDAAAGDIYIARAGSTGLITNIDGTEQTLTYDTEVKTSDDIVQQGGDQAFRIQNSGRYLVIVNTSFNYSQIANNNRHVIRTTIKVGGTELPSVYGMASGYGRDSGNADEDGAVVVAYLDHTVVGGSGDDITVHVQNFGDTSIALADQIADQSGIQIVRLPDDSDYLKVKNTTGLSFSGTMDFSTNDSTWNEFGWTTQDAETNSSVLEWVSGNDVTLKSSGHYLVIYAVRADTSGSARKGAVYRLKLDDSEVPASRVVSYMRGSDGTQESWVQWAGIVEAAADDVLNIDWASASETAGGSLTEAAMTVVKLPDTAEYVRVHYDANRAGESTGAYPFNQESEDDAGVHDNATNNSRISGTSDNYNWLLFGSWFVRNSTADSTRTSEHFRWFRSGSEVPYGSGLSYTRGDQSSTGVPAGGRNAAMIADSLGSGEYIELNMRLESGTGNQNRDFIGGAVGITGVALDTLVAAGNTAPVASAVNIDSDASSVTLTESTTTAVVCEGTVTDANGYADITSVTADFYRTSVGTGGGTDANNYYQLVGDANCVPSDGSGNSETYTCTFAVEYYADPTDSGSPNSSDDWTCMMTPTDTEEVGTSASDTIEVDSLMALNVTSLIDYGTVNPNTDTGSTNQITTVTNTGNRDMDPQISGTEMTCASGTIPISAQQYASDNFTFGVGNLSGTPTTLNLSLPQQTDSGVTDDVYWGIGVPNGTPACTPYTGSITFTPTAGL